MRSSNRPVPALQIAALAVVAWGALAFGGVYPWAYWPLAVSAGVCGVLALVLTRAAAPFPISVALTAALILVAAGIALQLVPLPVAWLTAVSPRSVELLREINPAFAAGLVAYHPASVWPRDTIVALSLYSALAALLVGLAQLFAAGGAKRFVEALTGLAVLLALIGIVQKPLYSGAVYGFWQLELGRNPFGPFVNKNHFAGWMVMALPLTLALLVSGIARSMASVKPGWRNRVLWFSSPEASRLILVGAGATVMALSLMLTMSRSGIGAFVVSVLVTGWLVSSALDDRSRKISATVCLVLLVAVVVAWTGPAVLANRFSASDWGEFNNRRGAWADAWSIAREFPLTGTGLNTYWAAALFYQKHELAYFFAQAHNDYLQLAAEGGLLLTVPAAACLALFVRDLRRGMREQRGATDWWLRAGAVTSLVAIALQESVDFSLQMPGNAALFAVVCAVALHRPAPAPQHAGEDRPPRESGRPHLRLIAQADRDRQCR